MGHAEEIIGQPNLPAKWKSSLCLLRMFQKGSLSLCFSTSHFFGEGTCTFVSPTQEGCSGQYVTQCCCPEPSLAVPPQTVDAAFYSYPASSRRATSCKLTTDHEPQKGLKASQLGPTNLANINSRQIPTISVQDLYASSRPLFPFAPMLAFAHAAP
ncbi:uncharacterized protein AFUA_1G10575 [Aspergillus fumigatus Af293]